MSLCVNIKFFIFVNKRRCIILFFLLRTIILYLQERSVIIHRLIQDDIHFHVLRNVYCHYISSYIMKNKYCHYTSSRIIRYTFSCIKKYLLSLYIFLYNEK